MADPSADAEMNWTVRARDQEAVHLDAGPIEEQYAMRKAGLWEQTQG